LRLLDASVTVNLYVFHMFWAGVVWDCFVAGKGKGEQRFWCLLYPEAAWIEKAGGKQPLADESGLRKPF
jgi:hypothetical protein